MGSSKPKKHVCFSSSQTVSPTSWLKSPFKQCSSGQDLWTFFDDYHDRSALLSYSHFLGNCHHLHLGKFVYLLVHRIVKKKYKSKSLIRNFTCRRSILHWPRQGSPCLRSTPKAAVDSHHQHSWFFFYNHTNHHFFFS